MTGANLRLFDYAASGNCYKVRLLLAQLGRPYERIPVDIFDGDTLTDEFARMNPFRSTPVLEIAAGSLVVIAGQVAIDEYGEVVGADIEDQARATLTNCRSKLAMAGCSLADVFKANVYLASLSDWDRFNRVYSDFMGEPLPVRTTVQAVLMSGFLVEIEMWAARPEAIPRWHP